MVEKKVTCEKVAARILVRTELFKTSHSLLWARFSLSSSLWDLLLLYQNITICPSQKSMTEEHNPQDRDCTGKTSLRSQLSWKVMGKNPASVYVCGLVFIKTLPKPPTSPEGIH